jgi:tetratricopeptide (TPR) repeat protein
MSQEPEIVTPSAGPSRRRRLAAGAVAAAVLALLIGLWLWHRRPRLEPPLPDLTGVDPEVVETITQARRDLLQKPSSAPAWGHLGMVLNAHGFLTEANRCFAEAERLNPAEPRWPYLQGVNLLPSDPDSGIAFLERAVEGCGDAPLTPRLRLAEALLDRGRLADADRHLKQTLAREPHNLRARLSLGRLAFLREDWRNALKQLAACGEDEHTRKLAHTLSAQVRRRLGEGKRAEAEADGAEQLPSDANWPDPYTDAVAALQRGLHARIQQAAALTHAGKPGQAIQLLEQTSAKYPESVEIWLGLGGLWFQLGRPDRAEGAFHKAVEADPDAAEGWFRLGCIQALDRPREAADSFRRVIRLRPDHTLAHFNLGHRLKQLGDLAGAAEEFRATLRCRPDYAPARDALHTLEEKGGKAPAVPRP